MRPKRGAELDNRQSFSRERFYLLFIDTLHALLEAVAMFAQHVVQPYGGLLQQITPNSLAFAIYYTARLHQLRREAQAAHEQAEALITFATEHGFAYWLPMGTFLRGWAVAAQGEGEEGSAQMHQGTHDTLRTGAQILWPVFLALLAEAYGKMGQVDAGLRVRAEAHAALEKHGQRYYEVEMYRTKGELLLRQDTPDASQAEICFQQARNIARQQQAKSWELRATTSLARLWQSQGKRQEAYALLASVYGWFTEGFDTADLQEAKALLEALQGSEALGRKRGSRVF